MKVEGKLSVEPFDQITAVTAGKLVPLLKGRGVGNGYLMLYLVP